MPEFMWYIIAGITIVTFFLLVYIAITRGLKISKSKDNTWSLDVPGKYTEVFQEKDGNRIFIESNKAFSLIEKISDLKVAKKNLMNTYLSRAITYTETKMDSFLYTLDDVFLSFAEAESIGNMEIWKQAIGPLTGNLRRKMIEEIFKRNFLENGFFEYKTINAKGEIGVTRDWEDYVLEKTQTIEDYIKHYFKNKIDYRSVTDMVTKQLSNGAINESLRNTVLDIYNNYWKLYKQMKEAEESLNSQINDIYKTLKEEKLP